MGIMIRLIIEMKLLYFVNFLPVHMKLVNNLLNVTCKTMKGFLRKKGLWLMTTINVSSSTQYKWD